MDFLNVEVSDRTISSKIVSAWGVRRGKKNFPSSGFLMCDGWVWFGCGGRLLGIWVGTWGRGFRCGASDFGLVSRMQLAQRYRGFGHFLSAASSSRREAMVGGVLARASALRVGLGVGGAAVASGSRARPSYSCDRLWFWFQDFSSRNVTVASATSSAQRLLRDLRQWSAAPW